VGMQGDYPVFKVTFYVATFVKPFRALFASLVSYTTCSTK
jgi:hypothetical protein